MPVLAKWITLGATLLLTDGCAGVRMGPPRGVPTRGSLPPIATPAVAGGEARTVCRSSSAPSGYVITDYLSSTGCESTTGRPYNAMRIEDVSKSPIGTVMLICTNQRLPSDWDRSMSDVGTSSQCPRDPGDKGTSPTVVEIVRHRGG